MWWNKTKIDLGDTKYITFLNKLNYNDIGCTKKDIINALKTPNLKTPNLVGQGTSNKTFTINDNTVLRLMHTDNRKAIVDEINGLKNQSILYNSLREHEQKLGYNPICEVKQYGKFKSNIDGFTTTKPRAYAFLEYIKGGELLTSINGDQIINNINLIKKITYNILYTVDIIHKQGFLCLDLKPENFMLVNNIKEHIDNNISSVNENGKIKFIDFGTLADKNFFLKNIELSGTPGYISKHLENKVTDKNESQVNLYWPQIDIWSIGIILLVMLIKQFGEIKLRNYNNSRYDAIEKTINGETETDYLTICPSQRQYTEIDNMYKDNKTTSEFLKRFFYIGVVKGQTIDKFKSKDILLSEEYSTAKNLLEDTWFDSLPKTGGSRTKLTRKRVLRNKNTRKKRKYKKRRITNKKNKRSRIKK
jgi:serine/threonine protein kinase